MLRRRKHLKAGFRCASLRRRLIAAWLVGVAAMLFWQPVAAYPSAGSDEFDSSATITIDLTMSGGPVLQATVVGPTTVRRDAPHDPGDGHMTIDTEIVALELHGVTPLGPITVRESPYRSSVGQVQQKTAGVDFPADSFFDVFVEIETPTGVFVNNDPIRLQAVIDELPPFQAQYTPPAFVGVALYTRTGRQVGVITHASHFVGQKPSFSVAPGGSSGLDAAEIFDLPTAPRISPPNLGLTTTDDLDALSYGIDYINYNASMRFSVDPTTIGVSGSAVFTQASAGEAHADEFRVSPAFPIGGSNVQVLDETGDSAPPFPLLISDDVDALAEPPASFVDTDGDGTPDLPVYFSLAAGSPTLAGIRAGPADVLMSTNGMTPTVYITETALGLVPGDDIDALCLDAQTNTVLFSLAPGSPSLVTSAAGPADLFGGTAPPLSSPPPVYAPAWVLGLLAADDVDALKCGLPEVDYFGFSLAEVTVQMGPLSETIQLIGPAKVLVAIGPEGAAHDTDFPSDGLEQVQTELVQMELTGNSVLLGAVTVRLRDASKDPFSSSWGEIEESANLTPGTLDLPPFTPSGTADSFFDVFFEIEVGGQVFHTRQPKRMQATITHKPPRDGETYASADLVQLYDENNLPTQIFVTRASHTPNPPITLHDLTQARAELTLNTGAVTLTIPLQGRLTTLDFTGPAGEARDTDADGLEQISTELVQLELSGNSSLLGPIALRLRDHSLSPFRNSRGEMEERLNTTPGTLDLWPYASSGEVDSFFDIWVEIEIGGQTFTQQNGVIHHNDDPLRLAAVLTQTLPVEGLTFQSTVTVTLVDESGVPTGMTIQALTITPTVAAPWQVFLPLISNGSAQQFILKGTIRGRLGLLGVLLLMAVTAAAGVAQVRK